MTCKIDSHIPKENGENCECGYFRKKQGFFLNYLSSLEEGIKKSAKTDLENILDFVERWNKNDKEISVAESANKISEWMNNKKSIHEITGKINKVEQYKCKSYWDGEIRDCTCGKCY